MNEMKKMMRKKIDFAAVVILFLLIVYVISLLFPMLWAFVTTFKSRLDYVSNPLWLPKSWKFSNLITSIEYFTVDIRAEYGSRTVYIEEMALYSILFAGGSAFCTTFVTCVMAYASARYPFFFSKVIYSIVIITMSLPIVGALPSELQLAKTLHIYNSMIGMWIMKCGFLNLYYLVFYEMFRGVPKDFSDAAAVDGASNLGIMFRVIFPLIKNTFFTVLLILFIGFWNDYSTTIAYMPSYPTLAYGLYVYSFSAKPAISSTPMKLAGCYILMIPVLILFAFFHKKIMGNISMGGIKE